MFEFRFLDSKGIITPINAETLNIATDKIIENTALSNYPYVLIDKKLITKNTKQIPFNPVLKVS